LAAHANSRRPTATSRLKDLHLKTEPGDENNQGLSSLVGKVDIHWLEFFSQIPTPIPIRAD
jgi:predicted Ser/Thr protein kinase